jgi:hypothetical protein
MPPGEDSFEDAAAELGLRWGCEAVEALLGEGVLACGEEARFLSRGDVGEDEEATVLGKQITSLKMRGCLH